MPEVIVKYKDERTLEALQDFAKYFDYEISMPNEENIRDKDILMHGVIIIRADSSVDTSELTELFTGKNINPSAFRKEAWTFIA